MKKYLCISLIWGVIIIVFNQVVFGQTSDSVQKINNFGYSISANTKGISTIPNLTLGKPAAIFALSVGRKFSFDPEFRFALEGRPWTFIFWLHYQLLSGNKFQLKTGVNTSVYYLPTTFSTNTGSEKVLVAKRSLTGDIAPVFILSGNFYVGPYYMYTHNFDPLMPVNTHFLSLRAGFSANNLFRTCVLKINPQTYYLYMDQKSGFYGNAAVVLSHKGCPFSLTGLINKAIKTNLVAGENFLWNVGVTYAFNRKYAEKK